MAQTIGALSLAIGREGLWHVSGGVSVSVRIVDVKTAYGSVRYMVRPISGDGAAWIDSRAVSIRDSENVRPAIGAVLAERP